MKNLLITILTTLLCLILPVCAYCDTVPLHHDKDIVQPQSNNKSSSSKSDEDQNQRPEVGRPTQNIHRHPVNNVQPNRTRPAYNNVRPTRPSHNNHPVNYNRSTHNRPVQPPPVVATHSRTYYPRPRTYYTSTYYVEPAVVYTDNSYVVNDTKSVSYESSGKFGFGLNALISANSAIGNISNYASGGLGLYLKFRPVRYFSLELQNNYLFGMLQYDKFSSQSYVKTLFGLGTRIHLLDYDNIDVYAAIAGTISIWSYISDYDYFYDNYTYMNERGIQYGGQLGAGINYIIGILEIGADLRYTVESIPDFVPGYTSEDSDNVIHGMLLILNLGFSL